MNPPKDQTEPPAKDQTPLLVLIVNSLCFMILMGLLLSIALVIADM